MSYCLDCKAETKGALCKPCAKLYKRFSKECIECREYNILPSVPDDIVLCDKCIGKMPNRKCSECGEFSILPRAPSFVKICLKCTPKKEIDCTTPGCKGKTDATWKKKCYECWKAKK